MEGRFLDADGGAAAPRLRALSSWSEARRAPPVRVLEIDVQKERDQDDGNATGMSRRPNEGRGSVTLDRLPK